MSLSDRILVLFEGLIVGEFPRTVSPEVLGLAMTGGTPAEAAEGESRARVAHA
jgi:hypothetical protein